MDTPNGVFKCINVCVTAPPLCYSTVVNVKPIKSFPRNLLLKVKSLITALAVDASNVFCQYILLLIYYHRSTKKGKSLPEIVCIGFLK